MALRSPFTVLVLAGALLVGCTAGEESGSDTTSAPGTPTPPRPCPTGPAPGVTDDSIKIGVQYVDLASLGDVVTIDHGDYEAAYNAALRRHQRLTAASTAAPSSPCTPPSTRSGTDGADAACVQLTEDEDVFAVIGLLPRRHGALPARDPPDRGHRRLDDAPSAWSGPRRPGTPRRPAPTSEADVVTTMADAGEFDGTLGVFGAPTEEAQMNDVILPLLDELGVEVAESAIVDAPTDDITGGQHGHRGHRRALRVGRRGPGPGRSAQSGLTWASGTESLDYRPQMLLTEPQLGPGLRRRFRRA